MKHLKTGGRGHAAGERITKRDRAEKEEARLIVVKRASKGFLAATYSPTGLSPAVPSAQEVLTTEFGMGSGVSPPAMPPRKGGSVS